MFLFCSGDSLTIHTETKCVTAHYISYLSFFWEKCVVIRCLYFYFFSIAFFLLSLFVGIVIVFDVDGESSTAPNISNMLALMEEFPSTFIHKSVCDNFVLCCHFDVFSCLLCVLRICAVY